MSRKSTTEPQEVAQDGATEDTQSANHPDEASVPSEADVLRQRVSDLEAALSNSQSGEQSMRELLIVAQEEKTEAEKQLADMVNRNDELQADLDSAEVLIEKQQEYISDLEAKASGVTPAGSDVEYYLHNPALARCGTPLNPDTENEYAEFDDTGLTTAPVSRRAAEYHRGAIGWTVVEVPITSGS